LRYRAAFDWQPPLQIHGSNPGTERRVANFLNDRPEQEQQRSEDGMNPAQYFVVQSGNEWKIRFRNELFGPYRSRDEALLFAIDAAKEIGRRESGAKVLVEDVKDGFLTRWTYGERRHLPAA
jgi:hypothetical protein